MVFGLSLFLYLSASYMALLAEEVCGCKAELLSGGLGGNNAAAIIGHLWSRQPVLIPYPEPKLTQHMGHILLLMLKQN